MKPSFQTSPDQSGLSLLESFISVTVLNHLRPTLKPALRLNPHVDTVRYILSTETTVSMTSGPLSSNYSERYTGQLRPRHYLYFAVRSTWRWASIESGQLLILGLKSQLVAEYLSFYTVSSCRSDFFGSSRNTDRNYSRSALLYCTWRVISGLNYFSGRVYSSQFDG